MSGAGLISCIVPVYNGERHLQETIESILRQTYPDVELIIVDDGSTDGTSGIAAGYDARVRYVYQENAGPPAARNHGLELARGDFIAFLDADDLWHESKLEKQTALLESRRELGYCVTLCQNFWAPELAAEAEKYRGHRIAQPMPGYVTSTLLARRSAFNAVGSFQVEWKHPDSADWFLRASERGVLGEVLPEVLLYRRLHSNNRSRRLAKESREEFLQLLKKNLDRRRQSGTRTETA